MIDSYEPRTKIILQKLTDQSSRGCIENEWAETFIWDLDKKFKQGVQLSEKQLAKLEELFEQS